MDPRKTPKVAKPVDSMDVREIPDGTRLATIKFLNACRTAVIAQMADLGTGARFAEKKAAPNSKADLLRRDLNNHLDELNSHIARFNSAKANCTDVLKARKTFSGFNEGLYLRLSGLGHMYDLDALPKQLSDAAHTSLFNAEAKWDRTIKPPITKERLIPEPIGRTPPGKRR